MTELTSYEIERLEAQVDEMRTEIERLRAEVAMWRQAASDFADKADRKGDTE